jgi:hypothetical protein
MIWIDRHGRTCYILKGNEGAQGRDAEGIEWIRCNDVKGREMKQES